MENIMKKLSTIAAAAAIAASAAAPVVAETKSQDPFISTQGAEISPLLVVGGIAAVVVIASAAGTN
jgi:hypothetical protein